MILSKLYDKYLYLKKSDNSKIYFFKSGIFYICLDSDAEKISKIFNFKLTKLNDFVLKCGFPLNSLEHYIALLQEKNINFELVDLKYNKIENYYDYIDTVRTKELINTLAKLDMNNITFKQSFDLLSNLCEKSKQLCKGE